MTGWLGGPVRGIGTRREPWVQMGPLNGGAGPNHWRTLVIVIILVKIIILVIVTILVILVGILVILVMIRMIIVL